MSTGPKLDELLAKEEEREQMEAAAQTVAPDASTSVAPQQPAQVQPQAETPATEPVPEPAAPQEAQKPAFDPNSIAL